MYVHRTIESYLKKGTGNFPVLLVTGARQVGKTTLLKHLAKANRRYVTLDDPLTRSLAKEDPSLFLQRFPPPVLIDEIQYAPEIFPLIKIAVDRDRKPGLFWLTGSQKFHMMKHVSESLAGRVAIIDLPGFSRRERSGVKACHEPFIPGGKSLDQRIATSPPLSLKALYRLIWRGGFPEMALREEMDANLFFSSYVQTYLQRDVRDLANVGDEMTFFRFLRAVASRTGQILNYEHLSRDANVSQPTAKRWLSILRASGCVYLLEPWHSNVMKRMIKSPKLYFTDTGLCSWLLEWTSPETLEAGSMSGAMLETWVINEIIKSYQNAGIRPPLYFYRDKDKREIDLLIIRDGEIHPVEIKKTASPSRRDIKHFSLLDKSPLEFGTGALICLIENPLPLTESSMAIPAGML